MMSASERYIGEIERLIAEVKREELIAIEAAAEACARSLMEGGFVYAFGTGHSHMLAEELFYRAGGLVRVQPILDPALMLHESASRSSQVERLPGYAETLFASLDQVREGDVLFVFSNSGRNTVSVEMALLARKRGLITICITNRAHSEQVESRHVSGQRLFEVCDIVIGNQGCMGDAAVSLGDSMVGATSTVIGAMILQAIVSRTVELIQGEGEVPEVFTSANTEGGDAINDSYLKRYRPQVKGL